MADNLKSEIMLTTPHYEPPRPKPLPAVLALMRSMITGDKDLLSFLAKEAYEKPVGYLGYSRRSILIINDPDIARDIMTEPSDIFPKNDLMVGALEPLVGESIFVSDGDAWRRQRRMVDPAFTLMRITKAFGAMQEGVNGYLDRLGGYADQGETFSLDLAMSHLTADIICRTVFSTSLETDVAQDVFHAFAVFEKSVADVEIKRLLIDKPWTKAPQPKEVQEACELIRDRLADLLDTHMGESGQSYNDIASQVISARDPESGDSFTRKELIDQLGVFFLAGHETSASVLTWCFFILSQHPDTVARIRAEVEEVCGDAPVSFEATKKLTFTRNVFRETLRLYPPITFIPRVAAERAKVGPYTVKKGAMLMIAPWTMHRHAAYWDNPHAFVPDRFEGDIPSGSYIPFGQGPRICVGAAFATVEATLILAELVRHFDFTALDPENVYPAARLTTRPGKEIQMTVSRRAAP